MRMMRAGIVMIGVLAAIMTCGCIPGLESDAALTPAASAPADDVLVGLLRAIEEKRPDKFAAGIDPACVPSRDTLWDALNTFTGQADLIEYNVTVERRLAQENQITYVFTWQRKHKNRDTGETISAAGRSEWTFAKQVNGPFLLVSAVGTPLF